MFVPCVKGKVVLQHESGQPDVVRRNRRALLPELAEYRRVVVSRLVVGKEHTHAVFQEKAPQVRSFSACRRPCAKPARSSPTTTKGNRIASASSRSVTVPADPRHRSTYRFVSSATLIARGPRRLCLDRRALPSTALSAFQVLAISSRSRRLRRLPRHTRTLRQRVDGRFVQTLARRARTFTQSAVDRCRNAANRVLHSLSIGNACTIRKQRLVVGGSRSMRRCRSRSKCSGRSGFNERSLMSCSLIRGAGSNTAEEVVVVNS